MKGLLPLALALVGPATAISLDVRQYGTAREDAADSDMEGIWPDAEGWRPKIRNPSYFTIMMDHVQCKDGECQETDDNSLERSKDGTCGWKTGFTCDGYKDEKDNPMPCCNEGLCGTGDSCAKEKGCKRKYSKFCLEKSEEGDCGPSSWETCAGYTELDGMATVKKSCCKDNSCQACPNNDVDKVCLAAFSGEECDDNFLYLYGGILGFSLPQMVDENVENKAFQAESFQNDALQSESIQSNALGGESLGLFGAAAIPAADNGVAAALPAASDAGAASAPATSVAEDAAVLGASSTPDAAILGASSTPDAAVLGASSTPDAAILGASSTPDAAVLAAGATLAASGGIPSLQRRGPGEEDEWMDPYHNPDYGFRDLGLRLENGVAILEEYHPGERPKLPAFLVDSDTQCYTANYKPFQLYVDTVTAQLKYSKRGQVPRNGATKIGFNRNAKNPRRIYQKFQRVANEMTNGLLNAGLGFGSWVPVNSPSLFTFPDVDRDTPNWIACPLKGSVNAGGAPSADTGTYYIYSAYISGIGTTNLDEDCKYITLAALDYYPSRRKGHGDYHKKHDDGGKGWWNWRNDGHD